MVQIRMSKEIKLEMCCDSTTYSVSVRGRAIQYFIESTLEALSSVNENMIL